MSDFVYLTFDQVAELNQRHGGPGAGVKNAEGIRAQLGRVDATFAGAELYPNLWQKAAVLLHGIASTQYFHDGNKRTAWLTAVLFLSVNDSPLRDIPETHAEAFVLSVATGLFSVEQAAEWLYDARIRASDRLQFAEAADNARSLSPGAGIMDIKKSGYSDFHISDPAEFPGQVSAFQFILLSRWVFDPADMGRTFAVTYEARGRGGEPAPYAVHPLFVGPDALPVSDSLFGDGLPTSVRLVKAMFLIVSRHGYGEIVIRLDGEEAGAIKLTSRPHLPPVPDDLSSLGDPGPVM